MIFQLDDSISFPDPRLGEPNGCFAVGGDLSVDRLLLAYSNGIFPWYDYKNCEQIVWYCPMQRFVIFPNEIHISHSMRTLLNKDKYKFSINNAFEDVMRNCAEVNNRNEQEGAWLGEHIIEAYTELYKQRFAASVEVWNEDDNLVGGLSPPQEHGRPLHLVRRIHENHQRRIKKAPTLDCIGANYI